MAGVVFTVAL